jgi:hypothetical protein
MRSVAPFEVLQHKLYWKPSQGDYLREMSSGLTRSKMIRHRQGSKKPARVWILKIVVQWEDAEWKQQNINI